VFVDSIDVKNKARVTDIAPAGLRTFSRAWAIRIYNAVQLIKFITSLKRMYFEMPNGTYSQR